MKIRTECIVFILALALPTISFAAHATNQDNPSQQRAKSDDGLPNPGEALGETGKEIFIRNKEKLLKTLKNSEKAGSIFPHRADDPIPNKQATKLQELRKKLQDAIAREDGILAVNAENQIHELVKKQDRANNRDLYKAFERIFDEDVRIFGGKEVQWAADLKKLSGLINDNLYIDEKARKSIISTFESITTYTSFKFP